MDGPVDPSPVPSVEPRERLLTLVRGYRISQAIYVAARLGIPDLLADGPREIEELAPATGSHSPSLRRVLRVLAGAGVLEREIPLVASGALQMPIAATYPLSALREAVLHAQRGGKVLLDIRGAT